ncbi:MAG: hypothetical protein DWQ42_13550 [Planctomycetota bacterium]|nr:MAG: hypothetical protein DWQ42_13550 [Planctomycetota bacterium]REK49404.1 MAG: hypothetical protein DWQ46_00195 [Planctomycetota bacterium]
MRLARQRGWQLADGRLRLELAAILQRLKAEVSDIDRSLKPVQRESRIASVREIYGDLLALLAEFDDVWSDRRHKTLSVKTEPVELEGVYLGPFEIRLDWSDLSQSQPPNYRVVALDANPAAANSSVTHPHVQDDAVCEGEARQTIRTALSQGRLFDFFTIVASLLRTYNAGSPFVALSDWHGVECSDCGAMVADEERWICEKCETTVCGDCYINCAACDTICCSECLMRCQRCDEIRCGDCMKRCLQCRAELCQECLDNTELLPAGSR